MTEAGLRIKRPSLSALITAVAEHFAGLGGAVDAEQYVHAQLCERTPHLCRGVEKTRPKASEKPSSGGGGSPLYRLAAAHVDRVFRKLSDGTLPAADADVTRRLSACAQCPAARSVDTVGCSRCIDTLRRARSVLGARFDQQNAPLCAALGVDCFAAAKYGIQQPEPAETRVPARCWVIQKSGDPSHHDDRLTS